jgi:hypothetical protein
VKQVRRKKRGNTTDEARVKEIVDPVCWRFMYTALFVYEMGRIRKGDYIRRICIVTKLRPSATIRTKLVAQKASINVREDLSLDLLAMFVCYQEHAYCVALVNSINSDIYLSNIDHFLPRG